MRNDGTFIENKKSVIFFGNKNFQVSPLTPGKKSYWGNQIHDAELIEILEDTKIGKQADSSDGMLTYCKEKKLFIQTADCVPCFLVGGARIFSLHLGWKSLEKGLLDKALGLFGEEGSCAVYIGPHIQFNSFEVGKEVVELFNKHKNIGKNWFLKKENNKYQVSLKKIIENKLQNTQANIEFSSEVDTFSHLDYYSYRRDSQTPFRNQSFAFLKE